MPTKTEPLQAGEYVVSRGNGEISEDMGTLILGQNLTAGMVLGRITASGLLTRVNPAASDGSQNAMGILFKDVNATAANTPALFTARMAEVRESQIQFSVSATGPQIATMKASLAALFIIFR